MILYIGSLRIVVVAKHPYLPAATDTPKDPVHKVGI
jgi:hypothetical protein